MNRAHDSNKAIKSIEISKLIFDNISVDLLYGLPNSSVDTLNYNIDILTKFNVNHISSYAITLEPKTALEKYVKKGSKVYVEGELQTRKWQDQEGKDRYSTEVILQGYNCNLTLLDSRNQSNNSVESQSESMQDNSISDDSFGSNSSDSSDLDEDIPF